MDYDVRIYRTDRTQKKKVRTYLVRCCCIPGSNQYRAHFLFLCGCRSRTIATRLQTNERTNEPPPRPPRMTTPSWPIAERMGAARDRSCCCMIHTRCCCGSSLQAPRGHNLIRNVFCHVARTLGTKKNEIKNVLPAQIYGMNMNAGMHTTARVRSSGYQVVKKLV